MEKLLQSIFAFTTVAILMSCGRKAEEKPTVVEDLRPVVKLASVFERPVAQVYEYTGTIEPEFKNNIAPASPLRIDRILVEVGDFVRKGQKLVYMDTSSFKQTELQLDNEKREFERIDELFKVGGVSKSEWDVAKMSLDIRQTAYDNLLENTTLLSPIDGIITARNYDNGDLYSGTIPVLTVEQISPVKLLVSVSESHFSKLNKGSNVDVRLDVYPSEMFEGKVSLVYPTINPETRTFTVEIKLKNAKNIIRPGMFARAVFNFGNQNHVVVPDQAIVKQSGSGERFVYVFKNDKVFYQKVELGRRMGDEFELISGVENNASVVIAGQSRLANGVEVRVVE